MKHPFDKIYVLHLANNNARLESFKKEFEKIGIKDYEIWWTSKRPWSVKIALSAFPKTIRDEYYDAYSKIDINTYGYVFNCTFEHYSIIKQAYERGINSILICEDDIEFIKSKEEIEQIFNNLPENYSIVKFTTTYPQVMQRTGEFTKAEDTKESWHLSTLCYCMSRAGMKLYIDSVDRYFTSADTVFKNIDDKSNIYLTYNICKPNGYKSEIVKNY